MTAVGAVGAAGCGSEEGHEAVEGEPLELGELTYNVQLSRFLNPDDTEDRFYLTGQKPLPASDDYFGVFIQIKNGSDEPQPIPRDMRIEDTQDNHYSPVTSESDFALNLGGEIEGKGTAPVPDSPARSGPTEGALVLFVVNNDITEDRPLNLIIPGPDGEHAEIKLDI